MAETVGELMVRIGNPSLTIGGMRSAPVSDPGLRR
jgi:hypothetical protein